MSNLANVIIIGAQKCGTTTLYYSLIHHSKICVPIDPESGNIVKEIDFFFEEYKWKKGVNWYKSHFKLENDIFLDASPNYLTNPSIYKRLRDVCPDAKIIICLRNPINRAYSQYNHYRQDMPYSLDWDWDSSLNFEQNIKLQLDKKPDFKTDFTNFIGRGIYINQLEQLAQYFPKTQIHITIMEHWKEHYKDELDKILKFLNLEQEMLPLLPRHDRSYTVESIKPQTIAMLKEFYNLYNKRLFKFIGYSIPEWEH